MKFIIFLFYSLSIFCSNEKENIGYTKLIVNKLQLYTILDSIKNTEYKKYYDFYETWEGLTYSDFVGVVEIYKRDKKKYQLNISLREKDDISNYFSRYSKEDMEIIGYLEHNNGFILVAGEYIPELFSKTEEKGYYDFMQIRRLK